MARNLRDKIRLAIQDCYDLRHESVVSRLETLLNDELQLQYEERSFVYDDLCYIQSMAAQEFIQIRHDKEALGTVFSEPEKVRTVCIVHATVGFLRQKGLLSSTMKYKK